MTDINGDVLTSESCLISYPASFAITAQPESKIEAEDGDTITLKVEASGSGLTYQWQYSVDGGKNWNNMSSAMGKKNSFSTIMNSIFNGRLYCCIVTDASGETLISETCKIGYSVNAENALAS